MVATFVVLATAYNLTTPPWEAPDEVAHFAFAEHVVRHGALPVPDEADAGESHQPPLYYVVVAAAIAWIDLDDESGRFRFNRSAALARAGGNDVNVALHGDDEAFPFRGVALALHVGRAVSTAAGAVTVAVAIALARAVCGPCGLVPALAGVLVALNPQFAFVAGAVNNDALASALAGATLLALMRALARPVQRGPWLCAGALCSGALLAKLTALPLLPVIALALALTARDLPRRIAARNVALVAGPLAASSGWWFARNHLLLGDPLGVAWSERAFRQVLRTRPLGASDLADLAVTQLRSFWALFGWMNVPAPWWIHALFATFTATALAGFALVAAGRTGVRVTGFRARALLLLVAAIVLQEAFIVAATHRFDASWYQGRYLFPAIAPIAAVLGIGVLGPTPEHLRPRVAAGLAASLLAIAIALPPCVVAPAYRRPEAAAGTPAPPAPQSSVTGRTRRVSPREGRDHTDTEVRRSRARCTPRRRL